MDAERPILLSFATFSPEEAYAYMTKLRAILRATYLDATIPNKVLAGDDAADLAWRLRDVRAASADVLAVS